MFQFNFLNTELKEKPLEATSISSYDAKEIVPDATFLNRTSPLNHIKTVSYSESLDVRLVTDVSLPTNSDLSTAESNNTDLLTGIYEGGLKVWECTHDLAQYISNENIDFANKNVLDLGCGSGIIGIIACKRGAEAYFQDYNEDVISNYTIPNVNLNCDLKKCRFYSGDWEGFNTMVGAKFDFIFTCETVYNPHNYHKLCKVFRECLKPDGFIYLAAKGHYFGCGGGLNDFVEFLKGESEFQCETLWKYSNGLERAILKIYFK